MANSPQTQSNKSTLLKMAMLGSPRPVRQDIGKSLTQFARKSSPAYDPTFSKQIRALRPDWFKKKGL